MVQTVGGGGGGGSPVPFVVGEWDMTGSLSTAVPLTSLGASFGGTAPNFELTLTNPLPPASPGMFLGTVASGGGISRTGTGQVFAKVTNPAYDGGDTIVAVGFFLCNSSTTESTVADMLNGAMPDPAVYAVSAIVLCPTFGGIIDSTPYVASTGGTSVSGVETAASGDVLYFGYDYDTGNAIIQINAGTVHQLAALDLTGAPVEDTLKVMITLLSVAEDPVLLDTPLVFSMGTTDGGKSPFAALGEAALPVGAADGKVYEVTNAGVFGGVATAVGDFVQLYDTTTKIIPTPNPATIPSLEVSVTDLSERTATLEAILTTDTSSVQTVTPGSHAYGAVPAGNIKQLVLTADNQTFTLSAATGKVCKFFVEAVTSDYSPATYDTFTLNGVIFNANSALGSMWEVYHNPAESVLNLRVNRYRDPSIAANIVLADGTSDYAIPHCSAPGNIILVNGLLTGDIVSLTLSGTQYSHLVDLYGQLIVEMSNSSAFGCINFQGTSFGLAPGEKAIRYPGGTWVKL